MQKILIIGSPGSGKSKFSFRLSEKLNIPIIHLDKLFWKSGWANRSKEAFDKLLIEEMEKESWIIDGNYSRTLPMRLEKADTVIFFDYSRFVCLWRVLKRVVTNYGKVRADMSEGCRERFDWEFIRYVWSFPDKQREKIFEALSMRHNVQVFVVHNRKEFRELEGKIFD